MIHENTYHMYVCVFYQSTDRTSQRHRKTIMRRSYYLKRIIDHQSQSFIRIPDHASKKVPSSTACSAARSPTAGMGLQQQQQCATYFDTSDDNHFSSLGRRFVVSGDMHSGTSGCARSRTIRNTYGNLRYRNFWERCSDFSSYTGRIPSSPLLGSHGPSSPRSCGSAGKGGNI
jgi:hypothetical protein